MTPFRFASWLLTGCFALFLATGCAAPGDNAPRYDVMVTQRTPFYVNGPDQQTPPNGHFPKGTRVRILSRQGAYSQVEAIGGLQGFVSSAALGPAEEPRERQTYAPGF